MRLGFAEIYKTSPSENPNLTSQTQARKAHKGSSKKV